MADFLHKKYGPFTVPVWGAMIGGGIAVGLIAKRFMSGGHSRDEGTTADEPIVAVDGGQVNYVTRTSSMADEDGTIRSDRPVYDTGVPSSPGGYSPAPPNPTGGQVPPVVSVPPNKPMQPPEAQLPTTPPSASGKPSPVTNVKAAITGGQVVVSWSGNDASHRVIINEGMKNLFNTAYGASSASFPAEIGHTYMLNIYKQLKPGVNSDPVNVTVGSNARATESYPGLPAGFQMNCQTTSLRHIVSSLDQVDSSGRNGTTRARYLASWAVLNNGGEVTIPGYAYIWHTGIAQPSVREKVNKTRVANGLFPLTNDEFNALQALMQSMMPQEYRQERDAVFQSLQYANQIFQRFNLPYQCGRVTARTGIIRPTTTTRL